MVNFTKVTLVNFLVNHSKNRTPSLHNLLLRLACSVGDRVVCTQVLILTTKEQFLTVRGMDGCMYKFGRICIGGEDGRDFRINTAFMFHGGY